MANYDLTYEGSEVQKILDTGDELQTAGYIFRGEANPSTVPGTPTERVAYIGGPGTYTNFGDTTNVPAGCVCIFKYTGNAWSNQVINTGLSDAISSAINSEATTRSEADTALQNAINSEATTRSEADTALQNAINSEATTRSEADTALQNAITAINNNIGNGYVFAGVAIPSTSPVTGKVFYLAVQAGTYTNFEDSEETPLAVTAGINILKNTGTGWVLDQVIAIDAEPTQGSANLVKSGGVLNSIIQNGPAFDLSAYNAQEGVLATYADLSAALTALNALPADFKQPGMSFKFVQSSDNNYKQYFCNSQTFTTNESAWEKINIKKDVEVEINKKVGVKEAINLSALEKFPYAILTSGSSAGDWFNVGTTNHLIIPNLGYNKILVKTSSTSVARIGFLKIYNGGNQPYEFADGFSVSDMTVPVNTSPVEITIPNNTNYIYITATEGGTDRMPQSLTVITEDGLKNQVDENTEDIADLKNATINNAAAIVAEDKKFSDILGYIYEKDSYTKESSGDTYDNIKISEIDISDLTGEEITFSASPVESDGDKSESLYLAQFYSVERQYISQLILAKDGGKISGVVPSNAKYIYVYVCVSNGTASVPNIDYTFKNIEICKGNSLMNLNKWNGKKVYVIGDSMTAMNPNWFTTVNSIIGFGSYQQRAVGGIGVVQMVDGNPSAGDNFSLTSAMVADSDLVIVNGCYNEVAKIIWNNIGEVTDMYVPNNDVNAGTFYGRMNYLIKRICDCLVAAGNYKCKVVINTPHSHGKNGYRNEDMDIEINDKFGKAIKTICKHNCITVIDVQQRCGINKYNRGYYSVSPTVANSMYIPADGVNNGTNKPFASVGDLPTSDVQANSFATVGTTESFVTYKYTNGSWNTDTIPYPWNGDQLHVNEEGSKRIGECVARELAMI